MRRPTRRTLLASLAAGGVGGLAGCSTTDGSDSTPAADDGAGTTSTSTTTTDTTTTATTTTATGPAVGSGPDWTEPHATPGHTRAADVSIAVEDLTPGWNRNIDTVSTMIFADGQLYVGSDIGGDEPTLFALDPATGESVFTSQYLVTSLYYANGELVFTPMDSPGTVYGVSATEGIRSWTVQTELGFGFGQGSPLRAATDRYAVLSQRDSLEVIDLQQQATAWTKTAGTATTLPAYERVAVQDGTVFVGLKTSDGLRTVAYNLASGDTVWETAQGTRPVAATADVVVTAVEQSLSGYPQFTALERDSGEVRWTVNTGEAHDLAGSAPHLSAGSLNVAVKDGRLVVPGFNTLFALELSSGELAWTYPVPKQFTRAPVATASTVLAPTGANLHAVDPKTGTRQATFSPSQASHVIPREDMVFIAGRDVTADVVALTPSPSTPTSDS